ncbi:MAG: shikimate kinase [Clostridia bacterium]|nr:shikimate kinase [Clostridia bacterium]
MDNTIFLIGMMGCGKSTMGRLLAPLLGADFLDLDEEIVRREGRSIPEIFSAGGEEAFRRCETAALQSACEAAPRVIATGGGVVTRQENIDFMRAHGVVIWLCRPLEQMIGDVRQGNRPMLAGNKEARMRALYAQRETLYRQAAHIAFSNHMPPDEAAALLAAKLGLFHA